MTDKPTPTPFNDFGMPSGTSTNDVLKIAADTLAREFVKLGHEIAEAKDQRDRVEERIKHLTELRDGTNDAWCKIVGLTAVKNGG